MQAEGSQFDPDHLHHLLTEKGIMMDVKPLNDRILVAENKKENKTESGIILEGARGVGDSARATALAIGPDVTEVKVGDVLLIDWSKASPVKIGDVQRAIIKEEFVIAVVTEE